MNKIYILSIMIIIAVTVDKIEDRIDEHEFKQEIIKFINTGSRNTANQGKALCDRINKLESLHNIEPKDCIKQYQ